MIELAERASIPFPLLDHDRPAEPGLRRFEHEELEVLAIVMDRHTPFAIVILQHQRTVAADPGTPVGPHLGHDSSTPRKNSAMSSRWLPSRCQRNLTRTCSTCLRNLVDGVPDSL